MINLTEQLSKAQSENQNLSDQINQLKQDNQRLSAKFQNEEEINAELERKLRLALAQQAPGSSEHDLSIQFDENGDRVK